MPDLDKWQQREARQYAADNSVSYDEAVAALFPVTVNGAPADEVPADEGGGTVAKGKLSK